MNKSIEHSEHAGYVYVLSNPSMPEIVKIGRSKHGGRVRAKDLYKQGGTGIPTPFHMEFELWSDDCVRLESDIHEELCAFRVNEYREFFSIDVIGAIKAVIGVFSYAHDVVVQDLGYCVDDQDLLSLCSHYKDVGKLINEEFNNTPAALVMATAIRTEISADQLIEILGKYKKSCISRRAEIDRKNTAATLEVVNQ